MAFKIIFCGTPAFAVPCLNALAADPAFDVSLVVTQPDRPVGRKAVITPPPVKLAALRLGIPVAQPESLNTELALRTSQFAIRPDFLVVVAYGQILNDAALAWPKIAPVNVHGSLLPRWRGASPVQHAILAGDKESGVTVQVMAKELDAGPILGLAPLTLDPRETAETLMEKLSHLGAALLARTLKFQPKPQPQPSSGITLCRKLSREDGVVDPRALTAEEIDRKVRALHPWPGVTATIDGQTVKILRTELAPGQDSAPLPCKDGTTLHLALVQLPGKKPMPGAEWARGRTRASSASPGTPE